MNRRGFLGSILALGAAPAIVRADSLMRIIPRDIGILIGAEVTAEVMTYGNRLLTIDQITRQALEILHKNALFVRKVNREYYGGIHG